MVPFQTDMEASLNRHLRLANDANCFALSEAVDGAASDATVVFGVILGTGCGGGLVVNKQALAGPHNIAGEWGHNPLPWPRPEELPGPACYCGKQGCIETFLAGPSLVVDYRAAGGAEVTAQQLVDRAEQGEALAEAALQRYEDRLARALATVINIVDPDAVVLGGGLSNVARLYERLPQLLPQHVFSDDFATPILKARHGDSSGVFGAARLWAPEELPAALAETA